MNPSSTKQESANTVGAFAEQVLQKSLDYFGLGQRSYIAHVVEVRMKYPSEIIR